MVNPERNRAPVVAVDAENGGARVTRSSRIALVDLSVNNREHESREKDGRGDIRRSQRLLHQSSVAAAPVEDNKPTQELVRQPARESTGDAVPSPANEEATEKNGAPKRTRSNSSGDVTFTKRRRSSRISSRAGLDPQENHNLACESFDDKKFTVGISNYDSRRKGDILQVPEYVADIFQRLFQSETDTRVRCYMDTRSALKPGMRMIVVDWLVDVHQKFRLEPATLYLSVHILDRYLSVSKVERSQLQLVGVTSFLLACKYEEIYPPSIKDCVYLMDRAFTQQDILDTEADILFKLKFQLSTPTSYPFMQRFLALLEASSTVDMLANYYMDRVLQEHDLLEFRPSMVAAAAVCLAINNPDALFADCLEEEDHPGIPQLLLDYTGFSREEIVNVASFIVEKVSTEVVTVSSRQLCAVRRKYSSSRFQSIATDFDPPSVEDLS